MSLTHEQIAAYKANGILFGMPVATEDEARRYQRLFNELEEKEGRNKSVHNRHRDLEFVWELASHPATLDCIEALIGPDILLLDTQFFCKHGPDPKFVAWHQDITYWELNPGTAITAWYAIDDSDRGNGCMRVIPGTHSGGIREHGKSAQPTNMLSVNQEVALGPGEERGAGDIVLKSGQISIHDGAVIHGSQANLSTRRRCGLTVRYIPTSVKPAGADPCKAFLVRGQNRQQNFKEQPHPFLRASATICGSHKE